MMGEAEERPSAACPYWQQSGGGETNVCLARQGDPLVINARYVSSFCSQADHVRCNLFLRAERAEPATTPGSQARDAKQSAAVTEGQRRTATRGNAGVPEGPRAPGKPKVQPRPAASVAEDRDPAPAPVDPAATLRLARTPDVLTMKEPGPSASSPPTPPAQVPAVASQAPASPGPRQARASQSERERRPDRLEVERRATPAPPVSAPGGRTASPQTTQVIPAQPAPRAGPVVDLVPVDRVPLPRLADVLPLEVGEHATPQAGAVKVGNLETEAAQGESPSAPGEESTVPLASNRRTLSPIPPPAVVAQAPKQDTHRSALWRTRRPYIMVLAGLAAALLLAGIVLAVVGALGHGKGRRAAAVPPPRSAPAPTVVRAPAPQTTGKAVVRSPARRKAHKAARQAAARTWRFPAVRTRVDQGVLLISNRNKTPSRVVISLSGAGRDKRVVDIPAGNAVEMELLPAAARGAISIHASAPVLPQRLLTSHGVVHVAPGRPGRGRGKR